MPRPSLIERYFAQCVAHRTPPRPEFVAGLRDGVMEVNLADVPVEDIRLFAHALLETSTDAGSTRFSAAPSAASAERGSAHLSSSGSALRSPFVQLRFSYNVATPARHRTRAQSAASPQESLLSSQNEVIFRCLLEGIAQAVKENAVTLQSFAWCGMPITATPVSGGAHIPIQRGGSMRTQATIVSALPLCRHLTSLCLDGVYLSRAQFMQLTMISHASSWPSADGAAWLALREASFSRCGLTDSCKGGLVHLVRVAVQSIASAAWQQALRGGHLNAGERALSYSTSAANMSLGHDTPRGLQRLDVSENALGDDTARALAAAIPGSALRTLNLSSTSVTRQGVSELLSPAVLEGTRMELVDLSVTGVSECVAAEGGVPDEKILAASTIATGFRVVAHGMGQLLILKESPRSPKQPWYMQTAAARLSLTAPMVSKRDVPESGAVSSKMGAPTIVQMSTTDEAAAPASPQSTNPFGRHHDGVLLPSSAPSTTATAATASVAAPSYAASYGPWWPMMANWIASQASSSAYHPAGATGVPWAPYCPEGYVSIPVPVSMAAQMGMTSSPHQLSGFLRPDVGSASAKAASCSTATAPDQARENMTRAKDGARCEVPPTGSSVSGEPKAAASPSHESAASLAPASKGTDDVEITEVSDTMEFRNADTNLALSHPTPNTSSVSGEVHKASEAAGDRKFLLALISRLEAYENSVSERIESHNERITTQLTALEKDMRFRLQQIAEADRKERAAAAERHTALLEVLSELRSAPSPGLQTEDMTEAMLPKLMHLIEIGMERVQNALADSNGGAKEKPSQTRKAADLEESDDAASPPPLPTKNVSQTDLNMVKVASQRLKQLGW